MADLDALRAAYRDSLSGDDATHLAEEQWERLACDEMEPGEKHGVLDHILGCALCSDTYRAIQVVRAEAASFDRNAPEPTPVEGTVRRFPWRGVGFLALAATVLLAVVLPLRRGHEPVQEGTGVVVRSAGEEAATPVAPVGKRAWAPGEDVLLQWTTPEPELAAAVEILDADGELLWTSPEVTSNEVAWPAAEIPGPGRFYWRVLTHDGTDSEAAAFDLVSANPP
jgi:hypothetical protein